MYKHADDARNKRRSNILRFSLAGIQLKFSAVKNAGLTIPAEGVGGSWIVKLPSERSIAVPEKHRDRDWCGSKYARTKRMSEFSFDELRYLAAKAHLSEKLVINAASETVARFQDEWPSAKKDLPIDPEVAEAIEAHIDRLGKNGLRSTADCTKRSNQSIEECPLTDTSGVPRAGRHGLEAPMSG